MSIPFKLYRIQHIDSQRDKLLNRCDEIDSILANDDELIIAMKREEETKAEQEKATRNLSTAEYQVSQQHIKIENSESSLYSGKIRNPKELQDLQKEIASSKKYLSVLEDKLLEAMFISDEANEQYRIAKIILEKEKARFQNTGRVLAEEKDELMVEIALLDQEKQAAANGVQTSHLQLYEMLRQQRRGVAVSKVENKSCSACGSILSASLLQAASLPSQISRCETCGRILYSG